MCLFVYGGNENIENGLNAFFFEKKDYLPFSFVQLGMFIVHSGKGFCTFNLHFSQIPYGFCTVGLLFRTLAFYVRLVMLCVLMGAFTVHLATHTVHLDYTYVQMDVKT